MLCFAFTLLYFTLLSLLCFALLCFPFLSFSFSFPFLYFTLLCFALLCFAFLCFALLSFPFLSFALLPFPVLFLFLSFTLLYFALLCFSLLCFALLCFALLCFALLCFALLYFNLIYFTFPELQKIPPPIESARKLMKYFLDRDPDKVRRFRRQTFLRPTQYDVTYVIDSSSSVNEPQFNMGMRALAMMVDRARRNTKYAAVTIATRSRLVFNFTDLFTAKEKLSKLRRTGGKTNTQEALQLCYEVETDNHH